MINLDQVRTLEWKVKQAVQLISTLRKENDTLRSRLSDTEVRLQDLESSLETFKATQSEMETGIRNALEELDHLEAAPAAPVQADRPAAAPAAVVPSPAPAIVLAAEEPEAEVAEDDFDAEFARLEAEEAAQAQQDAVVETAPAGAAPPAGEDSSDAGESLAADDSSETEVPESVELEGEPTPEETGLFDESAPAAPAEDERQPEQPGLGIF